ncbi:hypothetical protein DFJ73DRAFT_500187 [Zopfochytrium polystomum]|nr:hypothetical protein DFJ73DRAFT_500187 [Zopfochytrium polystomum]
MTIVSPKRKKWTDLIPQNWQCRTSGQRHPFFISYRQASESIVARELFYQLELALMEERTHKSQEDPEVDAVHPFLDAMCLSNGQKWGINFMSGLYHSHVIILLCSDMSMERMLKADVQADNVLLEWELALQMKEERGHDILPILLSRQVEATVNGERTTLLMEFSTFDHTKFPDRPHSHPLSPGRQTIRETIKSILELNGPKVDRDADVLRIVSEAKEVLSRRRLAQAH